MFITDKMPPEKIMKEWEWKYGDDFGWHIIPSEKRETSFVNVLEQELKSDDPFLTNTVYSVFKCDMNDDVLFLSTDGKGSDIWRIYHLTYSSSYHEGFPKYKQFDSLRAAAIYMTEQYEIMK